MLRSTTRASPRGRTPSCAACSRWPRGSSGASSARRGTVDADERARAPAPSTRSPRGSPTAGRYLCGERFTAADLTFACLAAPVIVPPEYGVRLPQLDELPEDVAATSRAFREHPAGAYALALFRTHRRSPVETAAVEE